MIIANPETRSAFYKCRRVGKDVKSICFYSEKPAKTAKSKTAAKTIKNDESERPSELDFLEHEAAADISELTGISTDTVAAALSDADLRPVRWAEKYVEPLQINHSQSALLLSSRSIYKSFSSRVLRSWPSIWRFILIDT